MKNKFILFIGLFVIGYTIMLMFLNRSITTFNFIIFDGIEQPIGNVLAMCIFLSLLIGLLGIVTASKNSKNLQKKNAGLNKTISDLKKELNKIKRDYAFQEKKVCFLEDTIRSDEDVSAPPKGPPKKKKPLIPWQLKIEKKK